MIASFSKMAFIEVEMAESKSGLSIFRTTRLMQKIYSSPTFSNGFLCAQLFLPLVAMLVLVLLLLVALMLLLLDALVLLLPFMLVLLLLFTLVLLLLFMLVLLLLFPLDCNL